MSLSPARKAAYEIARRVESGRDYAVDLLQGPGVAALKVVDRNLATELVMGSLRRQGELDDRIERLSGKPMKYFEPEIATILRQGIYQIRFLTRVPKSAAVNESVELAKYARKRSAAGLVNAVLRKCQRPATEASAKGSLEAKAKPDDEDLASASRSLPAWLRERWEGNFGSEAMKRLAWSSVQTPVTTLRVSSPDEREAIQQELREEGIASRAGEFSPLALVVESGSAQNSKAVRAGRAVIQDEASQLVALLVAPRAGGRVLDLCAAPGIKTGQLAMAQGRGLLVACDVSARRLRTMMKLLPGNLPSELRLARVRLDATRGLPFGCQFDRILVDAPCSGTGTLARNPEIKWRLRSEDLARLAGMQAQILRNALAPLAPGGRLVYATCSLEPEENEQVVELVLRGQQHVNLLSFSELSHELPKFRPLFDTGAFFRTRPDVHGMDGFFAAVMTRDS
jgi:16S rRNA (cytosine967-C5)-methyltransferase